MSDTMLLGVLRVPFDLAMSTTIAQIQYHQRGVQAADEIEKLTRERDEARAEVERLRVSNERLHRALFRIAGKAPFADDPWTIARKAMKREAKP